MTSFINIKRQSFLLHMEFIPVRKFYSNRDRKVILFKIRPSLTTSKDGLITLDIHLETTRI
jgi:hypothetical protein